jgi:hypothetical protein
MYKNGNGDTGYDNIFNAICNDQLLIAQDYENLEYMTRKLRRVRVVELKIKY